MTFVLTSRFTIGAYTFEGGVNDVQVKKSVKVIVDTATIKLPALSKVLRKQFSEPASSVETAALFKQGDKVVIELGYNGRLVKEFEGFVRRVNFGPPVTLELEGYAWQLRNRPILKSWKSTTVLQVLEEVVRGTDITLSKDIPHIALEKFYIEGQNGIELLEYFKSKLQLTCYFRGRELYVGLQEFSLLGQTKYRLGWNVIKNDNLKYRVPDDTRVLVRVQKKLKKGEQVLYEVGDRDGHVSIINLPNVTAEGAKAIGDQALEIAKYTGFEGKITAFLQPFSEPGYAALLEDPRYGKRSGSYFVMSTEVSYGMRGGRRVVELGRRLDG